MLFTRTIKFVVAAVALSLNTVISAEEILPIDCMIEPNLMVDVSSPVEGVLDTFTVDRSDEVKKGQVIATIKSDVEQVNVKISQERLKLSKVEYDRSIDLYRKKVITLTERDKLENEKKLYELNLENAQANLELKRIKSPIDGVVVKRYFTQGEFVESKPIITLAQLNPLKIEVISLVSNYGKIVKGMKARIEPEFGEYPELIAEVVVVDKVIDAASGTFGIRLELANKDHSIPSGLKCRVHFMPGKIGVDADNATRDSIEMAAIEAEAYDDTTAMDDISQDEASICSSVGPYKTEQQLKQLLGGLGQDIKHTGFRTETQSSTSYLVVSDVYDTPQAAEAGMKAMKAAGVKDIVMMKKDSKNRIALGVYKRKRSAIKRVEDLKAKGYDIEMKPRHKEVRAYWADILYMPASADSIAMSIPDAHKNACDESIKLSLLNSE
jgi:RND family efflux transporter MFP subunit